MLNGKQASLIAGSGISIEGNVISNTNSIAIWGNISGTLSNQADLTSALNTKATTEYVDNTVIDKYTRAEAYKTNKVYVDSNNVEHPVYRKILIFPQNTTVSTVTIGGHAYKAIEHGLSNFYKMMEINCSATSPDGLYMQKIPDGLYFSSQYILVPEAFQQKLEDLISEATFDVEVMIEYAVGI